MKKTIGFAGLGIMGSEMARRIISSNDFEMAVYNRTLDKCSQFRGLGATISKSPAELARSSDTIILMLSDKDAVDTTLLGESGMLSETLAGKTLIDMGTNTPHFNREVEARVEEKSGKYLEAPVLGSRPPAREGKLKILVGGGEDIFHEHKSLLSLMGDRLFYMGNTGSASRMKLIVNQIMAGMLALFSEGFIAGERGGISLPRMLEVLESSAIDSLLLRVKGPNMIISHDFSTNFPLKHAQKDLRQALEVADDLALPSLVTAATNSLFLLAKDMGYGEEDFSAIIKTLLRGDGEIHIDF